MVIILRLFQIFQNIEIKLLYITLIIFYQKVKLQIQVQSYFI